MSVGSRIRHFRQKNHLKQKELGLMIGLSDVSAEVRINQYESGARTPRPDVLQKLADVFHVSPRALIDSDVYSGIGFMHTMFAIEDTYDLEVMRMGTDVVVRFKDASAANMDPTSTTPAVETCLLEWATKYMSWQNGEITREEYDSWRYNFPEEYLKEVEETFTEEKMPSPYMEKYISLKKELDQCK